MSSLQLFLSLDTPPEHLSKNAILALDGTHATIHLRADLQNRTIQKAARMLSNLGFVDISLQGDWELEQQWCFYNASINPRNNVSIQWCDNDDTLHLERLKDSFTFAKRVVNDTPENVSPEYLADSASRYIRSLAEADITVNKIIGTDLQHAGWHGIYQVGRGSSRPPVMLEIDYNPSGSDDTPVTTALVGKGITFDSGGYSIKSNQGMLNMKADMAGAATVTAALGLAISNGLSSRVKLYLCCAENLISGHAYKLGDIITYKNGTTVEIHNTDAEGRLVLADGLLAATEAGAATIIDAATLTGAALVALGTQYNAVFSMDDALSSRAIDSATKVNEPAWRLPLAPWHRNQCPSSYADTANSSSVKGGGYGGASNAAGFLSRFVANDGQGWLHFDLAAAFSDGSHQHGPAGATGQGIRTIAQLLLDA